MTPHPCAGLSRTQRAVFEQIATNNDAWHPPSTIRSLMRRGLIIVAGTRTIGGDLPWKVTLPAYAVPYDHHMQWCAWCSENVKDEPRSSGRGN